MREIGPLDRPRRGVSIGVLLMWMIIAGAGGAIAWDTYGDEVRSRFGTVRDSPTPVGLPPANSDAVTAPANDEIVALVKDLEASQKQLEAALQLLTSEQATSKTTADALAALNAKVEALQGPTVVSAAKMPAPVAPRKPPAAQRPAAQNSALRPGAPTPLRP